MRNWAQHWHKTEDEAAMKKKLNEIDAGNRGKVSKVSGTQEFERRITAVGITPGSMLSVIQNEKKYPILIDVRNTLLAVDRNDCNNIEVEVM